ncbi:site-2 protease family protein [Loktanella agnita]|uniref:site-2 protease family protein n=1 Tax=Loktanella agnita TaxID=287097 RepID=UPI0039874C48
MLRDDTVVFQFTGPMGVRVEIGQSIVFLLGFIVIFSGGDIVQSAIFAALLFLAIFLHELGHAWGCQVQRIPVRRIMLHGGGGFCERVRSANAYQQELIVAMGPIVNLALWALASLAQWAMLSSMTTVPSMMMIQIYMALNTFAFLNLAFFIFNLIPVQPLDGGKLLHLILLRVLERDAALRVAGRVGLVLSILWIPAAIVVYMDYGWILFFLPSIPAHYRMARGQLA